MGQVVDGLGCRNGCSGSGRLWRLLKHRADHEHMAQNRDQAIKHGAHKHGAHRARFAQDQPARRPGKAARAAPHRIKAERHDAADARWKKDAKKRHPSRMTWRARRSDRLAPALAQPGRPKPTRPLYAKNNAGFACAWRPGRAPPLAADRPPHNPRPGPARILFDFARKCPCLSLNIKINIQAKTRGRPCGGIGLE